MPVEVASGSAVDGIRFVAVGETTLISRPQKNSAPKRTNATAIAANTNNCVDPNAPFLSLEAERTTAKVEAQGWILNLIRNPTLPDRAWLSTVWTELFTFEGFGIVLGGNQSTKQRPHLIWRLGLK
jgi:hypothetical protein